jgi:hypothetical protein
MKRTFLFFLSLILTQTFIIAQSTENSRPVKPVNFQKKITTISSGKARSYYALSTVESSVINIQGPGTLVVNTRAQFNPGETGLKKYTVLYTIDGSMQKTEAFTGVEPSSKASYEDGKLGVPAELRTIKIELLRGSHTIEFKLNDITCNVSARYVFTPAKIKKQEWMVFSPVLPLEPVDLISKEASTGYYRFSMEKPLKVDIIGPTELRVLTRTENHFQMKGRINYRVQVKENGSVINTYQLYSKVSEVAVYKDEKDLIPGVACEFVIYVPKGNHVYEIVPLDKDKSTLLGRLLIPVKDVNLEK